MTDPMVSMDTDAVGEFLTDGAKMRGDLHEKLFSLELLQNRVSEACVFASGDVDGPTIVDGMLDTMKALEKFAGGVRGDISEADQQKQFDEAGVTFSNDDGFTLITGDDDDNVEVHELADGRLVVYVNGEEIELTVEQSADLTIETGDGDDDVSISTNVEASLTVDGGAGNDRIIGGSGDDELVGGSGADTIRGRQGDDKILGGTGSDELSGGSGNDRILGGSGSDELSGGSGDDNVLGGSGSDELSGGSGDDTLYGGDGDDTIGGDRGDDQIFGNDGDDQIDGGAGRDELRGNAGTDTITGDSSEDMFHGNDNDTIVDTKPEPVEEEPERRPWYDPTPFGPNIDLPSFETPGWVEEGSERLGEFGEYTIEANKRRFEQDPLWFTTPGGRFDAVFEDGVAAVAIIGLDGELYHGDPGGFCGGDHSCITGVTTPQGGAITLGHTVIYDEPVPDDATVAHEQQHVYQYEEHGTAGFLGRWVTSSVVDIALGGDGYYDTEHEREGYYIQENFDPNDPSTYPSPDLELPDGYYPTTEPGSTRRYQRGLNEGGTFDDRGLAGKISAEIGKVIWF